MVLLFRFNIQSTNNSTFYFFLPFLDCWFTCDLMTRVKVIVESQNGFFVAVDGFSIAHTIIIVTFTIVVVNFTIVVVVIFSIVVVAVVVGCVTVVVNCVTVVVNAVAVVVNVVINVIVVSIIFKTAAFIESFKPLVCISSSTIKYTIGIVPVSIAIMVVIIVTMDFIFDMSYDAFAVVVVTNGDSVLRGVMDHSSLHLPASIMHILSVIMITRMINDFIIHHNDVIILHNDVVVLYNVVIILVFSLVALRSLLTQGNVVGLNKLVSSVDGFVCSFLSCFVIYLVNIMHSFVFYCFIFVLT